MRFRIDFDCEMPQSIPLNYQYPLSSWVYKVFDEAEPRFAEWLHEHGYAFSGNRRFKLFTFSWLHTPGAELDRRRNALTVFPGGNHFYVCFHIQDAAGYFIKGVFQDQELVIAAPGVKGKFRVSGVERIIEPSFDPEGTLFECLSPVNVSRPRADNGKLRAEYLHPGDPDYARMLHENLLKRYSAAYQNVVGMVDDGNTFEALADFPFDPGHWHFKLLGKARKRGQKMKEGTPQETQVIGYTYRFKLDAPKELLHFIWNAGLGEKGSTGWGCVSPLKLKGKGL